MTVLIVFVLLLGVALTGALAMGSLVLTICAFHAGILTGIGVLLGCLFVISLYITIIGNVCDRLRCL